ncbi:hypothetical protein BU15DRAFT_58969 [Melanogaster broomeanus]|nr:hypothetical protein BU15DRAFT_58969 [Melanogaster broomeanus]
MAAELGHVTFSLPYLLTQPRACKHVIRYVNAMKHLAETFGNIYRTQQHSTSKPKNMLSLPSLYRMEDYDASGGDRLTGVEDEGRECRSWPKYLTHHKTPHNIFTPSDAEKAKVSAN